MVSETVSTRIRNATNSTNATTKDRLQSIRAQRDCSSTKTTTYAIGQSMSSVLKQPQLFQVRPLLPLERAALRAAQRRRARAEAEEDPKIQISALTKMTDFTRIQSAKSFISAFRARLSFKAARRLSFSIKR